MKKTFHKHKKKIAVWVVIVGCAFLLGRLLIYVGEPITEEIHELTEEYSENNS